MTSVFLDIGSNINRLKNIQSCIDYLRTDYPTIRFSKAYESEAFGFKGDPFINVSAHIETKQSYQTLKSYLKDIEDKHARKRGGRKYISRTLDVDILLFGDLIMHPEIDVPRAEILKFPFVLFPLSEIASDIIHPTEKISIAKIVEQTELSKSSLLEVKNFPETSPKI